MTAKEFQRTIKNGFVKGGFLFFGEEEYTKQRCLQALRRSIVGEEDDPFNHVKMTVEKSGWMTALAEEIGVLPMFAEKKLVELHSLDYGGLSPSDLDDLCTLLSELSDYPECVLVLYATPDEFDAGRLPKSPSAAYKKLSAVITPIEFSYESTAGLNAWVCKHFLADGILCKQTTAAALIDFCSKDMFTLANEIDKLTMYTLSKGRTEVNEVDIRYVCCGKNISGAFDFTDALLAGRSEQALRLLSEMKLRRDRPEIILGGVVDTLSGMLAVKTFAESGMRNDEIAKAMNIHVYRVEKYRDATVSRSVSRLSKAMMLCIEADEKIKSSGINNYTVLDRLVMRLTRV